MAALTHYNEYMRAFDAEKRSAAFARNAIRAHVAAANVPDENDRREPKAPVDFHDEHSYDRAFRAEMRDCQRAEFNLSFDWRTK
jgi:hypothetical protein